MYTEWDYQNSLCHSNLYSDELYHHGILGQRWGIRRYQNPDGTLTEAGKKRYANPDGSLNDKGVKKFKKVNGKNLRKTSRKIENLERGAELIDEMNAEPNKKGLHLTYGDSMRGKANQLREGYDKATKKYIDDFGVSNLMKYDKGFKRQYKKERNKLAYDDFNSITDLKRARDRYKRAYDADMAEGGYATLKTIALMSKYMNYDNLYNYSMTKYDADSKAFKDKYREPKYTKFLDKDRKLMDDGAERKKKYSKKQKEHYDKLYEYYQYNKTIPGF